jgi:xanthine dehydrogenase accessory factor
VRNAPAPEARILAVRELLPDLARWRARSERIALATVVETRHSAPRPVGSKLAVSEGGELAGSVSGGCVENEVYGHAREVLAGAEPRLLTYGISNDQALDIGLPCGGELDVFIAVAHRELLDRLSHVLEDGEPAASVAVVDGDALGAQVLVTGNGDTIGTDDDSLVDVARELLANGRTGLLTQSGRTLFGEVFEPPSQLLVIGAVDAAEALCRAASLLGWRTIVADPRGKLATRERIPSADELLTLWPDEAVARMRPDRSTAVVVLTHEERLDIPALTAALATEAVYIGALGSRRTQAKRRARLLEAGLAAGQVDRISGPCGLDVGAETPAEMAVSIMAEILASRAGRDGGRLRASSQRIHAGVAR